MIILARAPFLVILASLAAMLALFDRFAGAFGLMSLFALLFAAGLLTSSFRIDIKGQWRVAAFVIVCTFLCSLWIAAVLNRKPSIPPFVKTTGIVVESRPWGRLYAVAVETPEGGFVLKRPVSGLPEGDRVRIEGVPRPFRGAEEESRNRSGSDFREDRFWYARGMTAQLISARIEFLPERWSLHRWRYRLYRALTVQLPGLTAAYLNAAWTGKRDAALNDAHRSWGTSHLLAVSGFHVGIVMLCSSTFFRRGKTRVFCLSTLLWLYIFLTGAPASAIRAGVMIQIALLGELAGRPASAVNSVSLAAVLLLLHSPYQFWDIGWRLSVLAALVIAAVVERGNPKDWRVWFAISPMVWLTTFPQVSWTFKSVPLVGMLINLVASPFFGFAFSFASVVAGLHLLGIPGMGLFLQALEGAFALWGIAADALALWIPQQLEWNPFFTYCCAGIFITLLCRAFFVPWRNVAVLAPLGSLAAFVLFGG